MNLCMKLENFLEKSCNNEAIQEDREGQDSWRASYSVIDEVPKGKREEEVCEFRVSICSSG